MAGWFKNTLQRWLHAGSAALALDLALIAALAAAAAYGTWVLLAPRAKAAPALGGEARARGALARGAAPLRRLFGAAGRLLRGGAPDRRGLALPGALQRERPAARGRRRRVGRRAGGARDPS